MLPAIAMADSVTPANDVLLEVHDLKVHFPVRRSAGLARAAATVRAVDGVTLRIRRGETLGLVGESGSGKTTLGRAVLRAVEPTEGRVILHRGNDTIDVTALDRRGLRAVWQHMQMVFQDPYASLNPRMTVRDIISEPLIANRLARGKALEQRVAEIAGRCGLGIEHLGRYPHAFSGGQRQRIAIARALILQPEFVVCDEPVSALDVSIQAQILNLLRALQRELGPAYLFISHDLAAVAYASDRVAVMYLGQIVELALTEDLYYRPKHPYTEALMAAIPAADPEEAVRPAPLAGERPDPSDPPAGCRFHTRCRYAIDLCRQVPPPLTEPELGHFVACHRATELTLKGAFEQHRPEDRAAAPINARVVPA
jgi:oligopeptide/dipeptide ABC transporter ATP-binding protein